MEVTLPSLTTAYGYENLVLLGHYAANIDNYLPKFRDNLSVPSSERFLNPEDGSDILSRNVGKKLLQIAASYPRRSEVLSYFAVEA